MHPEETAINDYVDGALDAAERRAIEAHAAACAACRQLIEDLREIREAAGSLAPREAPVRAWTRLERSIRLEREHAVHGEAGGAPRRARHTTWIWLAAAAALVLATAVGLRYVPGRKPATAETSSTGVAGDAAQIEAELRAAESHYEKAIQGLEQIAKAQQGSLDPQIAATLQKNLSVIDQAIGESRAALRAQPASEPAQQSLIENFKSKIALLQDTVALINEARKGNDSGAARIVSGLKEQG